MNPADMEKEYRRREEAGDWDGIEAMLDQVEEEYKVRLLHPSSDIPIAERMKQWRAYQRRVGPL